VPDEFLTDTEVAQMLKLNQQTVRNMIDRGDPGAVRVGKRRVRVRQSQLDAFLAAGAMTHETDPAAAAGLDEDPWRGVREAADAVATAVQTRDRDALEQALSALTKATRRVAPGGR
jgi:excisionase family DNA binding protein